MDNNCNNLKSSKTSFHQHYHHNDHYGDGNNNSISICADVDCCSLPSPTVTTFAEQIPLAGNQRYCLASTSSSSSSPPPPPPSTISIESCPSVSHSRSSNRKSSSSSSNTRSCDRLSTIPPLSSSSSVRFLPSPCPSTESIHKLIPDGGWGWMVVLSSLLISFLTDGFLYTSGVFYEKFLRVYGDSEMVTSIYFAIMSGMVMLVGPMASGLSIVYGCRPVCIVGAVITVLGMFLSTIIDFNMYCHACTLGIISGLGLGLLYLPQITIITEWFNKRLAFATGLSASGSGFGIATFAAISDSLIEYFNWKGAMIALAILLSLNIVFSFTFCKPSDCKNQNHQIENGTNHVNNISRSVSIPNDDDNHLSTQTQHENNNNNNKSNEKHFIKWTTLKKALKEMVNFSVMKNGLFIYFLLANFVANMVYFVPMMITSDHVVRSGLGNSSDGANLIIFFGLSNGFARPLCGFIADKPGINRIKLYGLSLFAVSVIVSMINIFGTNMLNLKLIYFLFGIAEGFYSCLYSVVLIDLFSYDTTIYNSFGILLLFDGIAAIIGPPLTNILVVLGHGYRTSIWFCCVMTLLSSIMIFSTEYVKTYLINRKIKQQQQQHQEEEQLE